MGRAKKAPGFMERVLEFGPASILNGIGIVTFLIGMTAAWTRIGDASTIAKSDIATLKTESSNHEQRLVALETANTFIVSSLKRIEHKIDNLGSKKN